MPATASTVNKEADSSRLPRIAAIFAIRFDQRVGYTIAWERSKPGLVLSGAVEYKSLPSGLHNVKEDLIYFVHESYAGISAFRSAEASEAERSARFVSVGVLLPRGRGRFGGGWLHAEKLKEFAAELLETPDDFGALQEWWEKYQIANAKDDASSSWEPSYGDQGGQSEEEDDIAAAGMSESTLLVGPGLDTELPPSHPIMSIINLLDVLGPFAFLLYRESLLRKRILFITKAPLLPSCNFVYNLSLLSSIPADLAADLPETLPQRPNLIFSIGVHDIPFLDQLSHSSDPTSKGWIACTSDALFSTKTQLSDIRVTLPSAAISPTAVSASPTKTPQWPTVSSTHPDTGATRPLKATQRDLRRYRALRAGLTHLHDRQFTRRSLSYASLFPAPGASSSSTSPANGDEILAAAESEDIVEPAPWAAVLYDSFMWWASAGARGAADPDVEHEQDREGLAAAAEVWDAFGAGAGRGVTEGQGREGVAVVAYFQRMTAALLTRLGELVESDDDEDVADEEDDDSGDDIGERRGLTSGRRSGRDGGQSAATALDTEDLVSLGLDAWSAADREFVGQLSRMYFEKEVSVKGSSVEWCGIRVC